MPKWKPQELKTPDLKVLETPGVVQAPTVSFQLKCLGCGGGCDVMYQGSSYCSPCLKEKLRVGR